MQRLWSVIGGWRTLGAAASAWLLVSVTPAVGSEPCQTCHDSVSIKGSVHEDFECEMCHAGREQVPHPEPAPVVDCTSCHGEEGEAFALSVHASASINGDRFSCASCHGAHDIVPLQDPDSPVSRSHVARTCGGCHGSLKFVVEQKGLFSTRPYYAYQESVHGRLVERGETEAAVCIDCHEPHAVVRPDDPRSPVFRSRIPATCGGCHASVYDQYRESIHGQAVSAGISAAPVCTSCHGIHSIRAPVDPDSSVSARAIARSTCAQCHQSEQLSEEFGAPRERVTSYYDSYHGLESALGSVKTANCASCHGVHEILPSSDPRSTIYPGNLVQTCGQCHPGATENFARGQVHLVERPADAGEGRTAPAEVPLGTRVVREVRQLYILLIMVVIGGMLLHNLLDFSVRVKRTLRGLDASHLRLTLAERLQHGVLILSFVTLAMTGFALKFPEVWWVRLLFLGSPALRANLHRIAAVCMMSLAAWHLGWLWLSARGREQRRALRPGYEDVKELITTVGRNLGMRVAPHPAGRFGYVEKAEYWALVWGIIVMAGTGIVLWAEQTSLRLMPKWGLDVAEVVHYYEAWLATLAIVVWHLYYTLMRPGNRTLRWTWLTGRLSEEEWREDHPGEHDRALERGSGPSAAEEKGAV